MKINITKNEYRLLIDILSISDWVMNAHKEEKNPASEPYRELEQKFLSFAKDFGFGDLIKHDKTLNAYFPTAEYEEDKTVNTFIEEYDNDVFWDELCSRLAQRDLIQKIGIQQFEEMEPFDIFIEQEKIAEKYNDEFVKSGIENFVLKTTDQ